MKNLRAADPVVRPSTPCPPERLRSTLLVLAAALALAACGQKPESGAAAPGQPAATAEGSAVLLLTPADVVVLETAPRATGPIVTGSLQPERRADLRAEVGSTVQQVLRDNGESVRAGDLIVRLDDSAIRESLVSAEEAVRAATQALEQADRQVARLRTLQTQGMTSMQALEDAEVRRNAANSELVAARARVASARQQLRRTEVRAPFAGVVSDRRVSVGDTAQVGRELVKVIDPASLRFEGLVSADRMQELALGQPVSFRVNGFPGTEFRGSIGRIDSAANPTTRQVSVLVDFDKGGEQPRIAGLFAEGRVQTGSQQVLMLAEGMVERSGDATHVWKLADGVVRKVPVKLGERDERTGLLPVLQGLVAGDRVLRAPGSQLVEGQRFELAAAVSAATAVPGARPAAAAPN